HIIGVVCHVLAAVAAGTTLTLAYRFHPDVMLEAIRERRPTYTIGAITAFTALLRHPKTTAEDLSSFEMCHSGGAPVPPAIRAEFLKRFGMSILTAYGMTETAAPAHICPANVEPRVEPESGTL